MLKAALRDTVVYGISSILSRGLAIFLLPVYTRVLSPAQFGAYDLLITLGVLANLVIALEVSQGLARYWADTQPADRLRYASTSLLFSVGMYGVFVVLALSFSPSLSGWLLGSSELVVAFRMGVGFIALNGIYSLMLNQFRWELRSISYAAVSLLYVVLTLAFSVWFCLVRDWALEGVMLAQLLATSSALLVSAWLLRATYGWTFDAPKLTAMLRFSMPLVPAGLAMFISLYINRFALNHFMSLEDVGLFGLATRIAGLAALLIMGVQAALTPLIYQHYQEPGTPVKIARLFGWFLALAL
ncbi:MAG: oligosaccharide flippase family protein, partial [Shewanella algae]